MHKKQQGIVSASFLLIVIGAIILFWQAVRLAPAYLENYRVNAVLESLATEPELPKLSRIKVLDMIESHLTTSNVKSVTDDDIIVFHTLDKTTVEISYNAQVHFLSNIDFVVHFSEQIEVVH